MQKILILYHCRANTGYAISSLETVFWSAALELVKEPLNIFLSYTDYSEGLPSYTPNNFDNLFTFSPIETSQSKLEMLYDFINTNGIDTILGFDQPISRPYYKYARKAGVNKFVSYQGAPMSSHNKGLKLLLKKIESRLSVHGPDLYIFESEAMRETAIFGRGIQQTKTTLCHLGVDTTKYRPDENDLFYGHQNFQLDQQQKLIFYSGHFEERKGVGVIVKAANILLAKRSDITFVLFGNQPGEEKKFSEMLNDSSKDNVIFGGYRNDLHRIHRSCHLGIIASTGWDSFTMSAIEIQSSGLPLLVSSLQGLKETIEHDVTGFQFKPGDPQDLSLQIEKILDNPSLQNSMSKAARKRVTSSFSVEAQVKQLVKCLN